MFTKLFITIITVVLASFTILCAQRSGNGQSPWSPPRSYCDHCRHPLVWWQLVPILGWTIQSGRCHFCRERITAYDPLCELISGLFAWQLAGVNLFHSLLAVIVIQVLLFIASCDYFYQYLYPFSLVGLFPLSLFVPGGTVFNPLAALIGLAFLGLLVIMVVHFHWLGGGDVLFIAMLLITLGLERTALVILLACLLVLPLFFHNRRARLPFLPVLCLATLVILTNY